MGYEVLEDGELAETVTYEYGDPLAPGNPTLITRKPEGDPLFYGTYMNYNGNDQLWIVTEKTWEEDEFGQPFNEQTLSITEFRGSGQQRYMVRDRDLDTLQPIPELAVWSDYGGGIYGDYMVDGNGDVQNLTAFELGLGKVDLQSGDLAYFHSDQIGTTRMMTDGVGSPSGQAAYSAFGELMDSTLDSRYGYAGAWGYESIADFGLPSSEFLHVGYRHYSPSTGRFLERDPIGIQGGLNVYEYGRNNPVRFVDPLGLQGLEVRPTPGGGVIIGSPSVLDEIDRLSPYPKPKANPKPSTKKKKTVPIMIPCGIAARFVKRVATAEAAIGAIITAFCPPVGGIVVAAGGVQYLGGEAVDVFLPEVVTVQVKLPNK